MHLADVTAFSRSIDIVTRLEGYPEVTRKDRTYILANQPRLYPEDSIHTNKGSRLVITMNTSQPRFEMRTPLAVIGVRSTDFWSGYLFGDNTLDVAMVLGKGICVENARDSVDFITDGWGTTVTWNSAPQPQRSGPA